MSFKKLIFDPRIKPCDSCDGGNKGQIIVHVAETGDSLVGIPCCPNCGYEAFSVHTQSRGTEFSEKCIDSWNNGGCGVCGSTNIEDVSQHRMKILYCKDCDAVRIEDGNWRPEDGAVEL